MADDRAPRHAALSFSRLNPWLQALLVLVGLWLLTVAGCPSVSVLACNRPAQVCVFEEKALLATETRRFPLAQLKGASLVASDDGDLLLLVAHTTAGDLHIGGRNYSLDTLRQEADEINAFVKDGSRSELRVRNDKRWFLLALFTFPVWALWSAVRVLKLLGFRVGEPP